MRANLLSLNFNLISDRQAISERRTEIMNKVMETTARRRDTLLLCAVMLLIGVCPASAESTPIDQLLSLIPKTAGAHNLKTAKKIRLLVPEVESWLVEENKVGREISNKELLAAVDRILKVQSRIRIELDQLLAQRSNFHQFVPESERQRAVRGYLESMTALIDLTGRMRYYSIDFFTEVGYELANSPADFDALLNVFIAEKNSVGAIITLEFLAETLRDPTGQTISDHLKGKIIQLARKTRDRSLLPILKEILQLKTIESGFAILIIDTIRLIGVPQSARPNGDPALSPPVIVSNDLLEILSKLDSTTLSVNDKRRYKDLTRQFTEQNLQGARNESFQFGTTIVQEGDWLLMKNPSPYNRFTDLYPGLFTHVGIVTTETGADSKRRFVVVDLPELGNLIPATPVDKFIERTLNFAILRHPDPTVQKTMGDIARTIIGNQSKFDLNFRTTAIEKLKGQSLDDKLIDGYCAGLLLLCAQETEKPLQDFFPLDENPAGGNTLKNLAKLDVSMPKRFLSPTGPFFSSELNLIYCHETMYSPRRQIEQAVYDHFAKQMRDNHLRPSLSWFHALRLNLAEAVETSPALGKALASAAGVNQNIDIVAAAKLGAVVETLDEIAKNASAEYQSVRRAFRIDALDNIELGAEGDKIFEQIVKRRRRHADLFVRWEAGIITPRELRIELVDFYISQGCKDLDKRFFSNSEQTVNHLPDE